MLRLASFLKSSESLEVLCWNFHTTLLGRRLLHGHRLDLVPRASGELASTFLKVFLESKLISIGKFTPASGILVVSRTRSCTIFPPFLENFEGKDLILCRAPAHVSSSIESPEGCESARSGLAYHEEPHKRS